MPDMKTLTINGVKYNIKDNTARTALDTKAGLGDDNVFSGQNVFTTGLYLPLPAQITWINGAPNNRIGSINESEYTGNAATATKATQDGAGNVIVDTYAKKTELTAAIPTKLSDFENDSGYLTMATLPIFASTDSVNRWTARQTFNEANLKEAVLAKAQIVKEVYQSEYKSGTAVTPSKSTMCFTATGAVTLDMATIVAECLGNNKNSTVFTAYITSTADYTLTITNAGTIKYIGSASDVAITSAGLLLNIMLMKDASGTLTSIVQASKLEGGA